MKRMLLAFGLLCASYGLARAADSAVVVSSCGSATYTAGQTSALTQDTTGKQCSAASASGSFNPASNGVTGASVPASADYIGGNKSGNLVGVLLDGASNLLTALGAAIPAGTNNIGKTDSPCTANTVPINQTGSTDIYTSSAKVHICAILLVSATAQSVSISEGTGSTCGSGTAFLMGGSGGTIALAANGGFSQASGIPFILSKTTADHICIVQSGSGNVSGYISFGDY